ncbi:MAG: hypothetical protein J0L87_02400 [Bacteroidetes bacterium]|nr:hypothetical protein [Bacteroidota bacterium]
MFKPLSKSVLLSGFAMFILLMQSCSEPKSELAQYGPVFEQVMKSDAGVFRGFALGDKQDTIQKTESSQPIEADDGYLYYEYGMDTLGSYNVAYNFEENELSEIQADVFITNSASTETVYDGFKKYFDQHYGVCEDHMGFAVWTVKSGKYGDVRINLSDESADFTVENNPGKISIWIYPDKN